MPKKLQKISKPKSLKSENASQTIPQHPKTQWAKTLHSLYQNRSKTNGNSIKKPPERAIFYSICFPLVFIYFYARRSLTEADEVQVDFVSLPCIPANKYFRIFHYKYRRREIICCIRDTRSCDRCRLVNRSDNISLQFLHFP